MSKRILFIGESALAHISRPLALAESLDPSAYDVSFACDPTYRALVESNAAIRYEALGGLAAGALSAAGDRADFPWDEGQLLQSVEDELSLFRRTKPDLVVSDYRFSVPISAARADIPSVVLTSTHWSPFRRLAFEAYPEPSLLYRSGSGERPRSATAVVNTTRHAFGLAPLNGFCEVATAGDYVCYADPPPRSGTADYPDHHVFLGPILWQPSTALPAWWSQIETHRPIVYLTLGSTGAVSLLPTIARALAQLPISIVVATAGRVDLTDMPRNVLVADYLPGLEVCKRASLVICNGGSTTIYQALSEGVPIIGIWSNLDQYLMGMTTADCGAGMCVPASVVEPASIARMAEEILVTPRFSERARDARKVIREFDYREQFPRMVRQILARLP